MKEPRNMFFSKEQIEQSIARLSELNPFLGIVFPALKKERLPVGNTKAIKFKEIMGKFLQTYYRPIYTHPYYIPFNKPNPWDNSLDKNRLQQIAVTTFSDVFIRSKGNREWGWQPNYVRILEENHLTSFIPTFELATWLLRVRRWDKNVEAADVIETFFNEFHITMEERALFDTSIPLLADTWLQADSVSKEQLSNILGSPPAIAIELTGGRDLVLGGTLEVLKLTSVGPVMHIECDLAPRLNLITGDNGLGKSFLLECAWWALTRTWAGTYPAFPRQDAAKDDPSISFRIGKESQSNKLQTAKYNWERQEWVTPTFSHIFPGLSIFAQVDGSFVVWDPAKDVILRDADEYADTFIRFSRSDIWNGVVVGQGSRTRVICNGLLRDWVTWQNSDKTRFDEFKAVLKALSSQQTEDALIPGQPTRMLNDARSIPTLKFPYGEVPILLCSAGIQRIVALAYLLVWSWNEHVITSQLMRKNPQRSIFLFIDEMEAHLHPFWQRTIVPALINVVQELANEVQTQIFITTHSPLVLASVEPQFDEDKDKLFHLYQKRGSVHLDEVPFVKRGRVDQWLISDVFGLTQPRSKDAEEAIEAAKELQRKRTPSKEEVQEVSDKLVDVLAQDDDFWPRWTYFAEQRGASV